MFYTQLRVVLVGSSTAKDPFSHHCRVAWSICTTHPCKKKPSTIKTTTKKPKQTPQPLLTLTLPHLIITRFFLLSEQSALNSLEVEVAYNPLHLKSNLYKYLKSVLYKPLHRQQAQPRDQRPERHQPKQVHLLPLASLDSLWSALLLCFLQKG